MKIPAEIISSQRESIHTPAFTVKACGRKCSHFLGRQGTQNRPGSLDLDLETKQTIRQKMTREGWESLAQISHQSIERS